mmetsp:Transcript_4726/g.11651  ORF Transcript_4726/g.11651 Transcript_4726/m.11651 type:complete len:206 (-) Transcript_4726:13-630(-)
MISLMCRTDVDASAPVVVVGFCAAAKYELLLELTGAEAAPECKMHATMSESPIYGPAPHSCLACTCLLDAERHSMGTRTSTSCPPEQELLLELLLSPPSPRVVAAAAFCCCLSSPPPGDAPFCCTTYASRPTSGSPSRYSKVGWVESFNFPPPDELFPPLPPPPLELLPPRLVASPLPRESADALRFVIRASKSKRVNELLRQMR